MTNVNDPSDEINEKAVEWAVVKALLGGTTAMREAGAAYLPRLKGEDAESHADRLRVATLFPALARTVSVMSSKPFSKPLQFGGDVPPSIVGWMDDCDLGGNNLHTFAHGLLRESISFGLHGVLVDYPTATAVPTLADERNAGRRPYLVHVKHGSILGWKSALINGARVLTQLRLSEEVEVDEGQWGTKEVHRVRVLEPGKWAVYEEQTVSKDKREYVLIDEGVTTLNRIPFVPFYGLKSEFMEGCSPLIELAYLNVQHWQDSSDQQKSVKFARVRIAAIIGAEDLSAPVRVGADHFMQLPANADIRIVQGSAESVKIGRDELNTIESQMLLMGAELLIPKPSGQRTATESNNDAEANKSDLQRIVEGLADGLDQCLQLVSDWSGSGQGGHVSLYSDYGSGSLSDASAQLVVTMQQGGLLTKATALSEMQRRGVISPDIVPEDELAGVGDEGPALGMMA